MMFKKALRESCRYKEFVKWNKRYFKMSSSVNPAKCEHALELLKALERMRNDERHCDFTIRVGNESFRTHRTVLCACSDYFSAMLSQDMKESREGIVDMKYEEEDAVKCCIDFMYTGEAVVTMKNAESILRASHLMQIKGLTNLCFVCLLNGIKVDNCLSMKEIADQYDDVTLKTAANKFAIRNFASVITTRLFVQLSLEQLSLYLRETTASQEILWGAILRWIKHDEIHKKQFLIHLLKAAKLQNFSFQFLLSKVWDECLVQSSRSCREFVAHMLLSNPHEVKKNITVENCFILNHIVQTISMQKQNEVKKGVLQYMSKSFKNIATKDDLLDLCESDILFLLQNSEMEHTFENVKWKVALKWTKKHSNRKNTFRRLLETIKFERFSKRFFQMNVLAEPLVKESHDCKDYLLNSLCNHSLKDPLVIAVANSYEGEISLLEVSTKELMLHSKFPKADQCFITNLNGDLYMMNGDSLLCYSSDKKWEYFGEVELKEEAIALLPFKSKLYIFNEGSNAVDIYDPRAHLHTSSSISIRCWACSSFVTLGEYIYVISLACGPEKVCRFQPDSNFYDYLANPNRKRECASATALNGYIYVLGGWDLERSVEFFNPATNTWTEVASMIRPRNMFSACVVDGKIYAVGGDSPNSIIDTIEVYDPMKNSWEMLGSMEKIRGCVSACVL